MPLNTNQSINQSCAPYIGVCSVTPHWHWSVVLRACGDTDDGVVVFFSLRQERNWQMSFSGAD